MDRIRPYIGKNIIKILTGQRRIGKSYILLTIANEIEKSYPDSNIITINLEDYAFSHITDAEALHAEIQQRLISDRKNYIFIDEIQEVTDFDRVIRSLALNPDNDIYITGSNSNMLSSEIASRLAGRSIEFRIHPLSYNEFLEFHQLDNSDESLMRYLRFGGLPYLRNLPNSDTWTEYLTGITDAIVYRDIVSRYSLRNMDVLQRLLLYIADNTGQIFTAKKIADYLKSQRSTMGVAGIQTYVRHIAEAYIINQVRRWDIKGKKLFEIGEKYYFEDLGIRNSIIGFRPQDLSGIIENSVFNHLIINGYTVRIGVLGNGREIDFIAERNNEKLYIQVALTINEPKTLEREFGNLEMIKDHYRKLVVTLHNDFPNSYNGIQAVSLREFLSH